ncbi:SLC13 family permease, partial [Cobetia amphilecti]
SQARASIDGSVLVVIAAALGLGQAMTDSGAAQMVADQLMQLGGGSPLLMLALVYLTTTLFTEIITNNAAAVLMFPIA